MTSPRIGRNPDFIKLWIGETVSLVGSAVTMLALPLTALNLLHATPLAMGALLACEAGAVALTGLFAGALADRLPRRGLLIGSDIGLALSIAAIPAAYLLGLLSLPVIFAAAFASGVLGGLFGAAYQGYLPDLVGDDALVAANSRLEGSRVLAGLLGALLGGLLVEVLSAPFALVLDAASFLVSALGLVLIRARPRVALPPPVRAGILREISAGLRFVFGQPLLRALLLGAALFNLFAPMLNGQIVLYAVHVLGLTPFWFGAGTALAGLGGVAMATIAPRIIAALGLGRAIVLAAAIVAGGWALLPLAQGPLPTAFTILAVGAGIGTMGDVLINISAGTLQQALTPAGLRGRVGASNRIIIAGLQPIGALAGGLVAQAFGERAALAIFAGGFICTFVVILLSPLRRAQAGAAGAAPGTPAGVPAAETTRV